ncbi:glycoside hydrolase family 20 protein [Mycena maculata]|uniref:Beta-hexosaminidase n=1 Tax=Mycena maculata TaxID=230809 RepID=A0AAD7K268_9AGAR|nr:glycoside hydrolase family 20 protein [Mycena maculata]
MIYPNGLFLLAIIPHVLALWPIPTTLKNGTDFLILSPTFDITVNVNNPPQDLLSAVAQAKTYLNTDKLQRLVPGRGSSDAGALKTAPVLLGLTLTLQNTNPVLSISEESVQDFANRSEGYTLSVPSNGKPAVLSANSTLGLFRGLSTFTQLWYDLANVTYTNIAPVSIAKDVPAYPYRGFMLDTARNFFAVSDIKRTLDAMSWVKINTFHWHIVDSQSFPLVLPEFPELAQQGAYSTSEVYSAADVQDIVSYAAERGIDVLMEIDTPGHTAIIAASHPDFVACNQASPWSTFANEPPAGQLRLASPATINFTANLFTAAAKVLPSKYFSTGGDEVNTECYAQDPQTQAELKSSGKTLEQALNTFTEATHGALANLGKTAVVWEEMILDYNLTLSQDTVVMVWISSQDAALVAAKNFRIVHAPSNYFYLDCGAGEWIGDDPSGNSWCDPFKTWQNSYTFDPLANLTSAQTHLVLGGEQLLWTEQSDPNNLDSIAWPRAATSAEIFWTGAKQPDGSPLDGTEALPRLHELRYRMVQRGVGAIQLQPQWCVVRPELCNLNS